MATSLPKYRLGMDFSVFKTSKMRDVFKTNMRPLAEHLSAFYKDRTADEYYYKLNGMEMDNNCVFCIFGLFYDMWL